MVARRGPGGAVAGAEGARTRGLSSDVFNEVGTAAVVVMDGGDEFDRQCIIAICSRFSTHVYIGPSGKDGLNSTPRGLRDCLLRGCLGIGGCHYEIDSTLKLTQFLNLKLHQLKVGHKLVRIHTLIMSTLIIRNTESGIGKQGAAPSFENLTRWV